MITATTNKQAQASLVLSTKDYSTANLLAYYGGIIYSMTNNSFFPNPLPSIDTVKQLHKNFEDACVKASFRESNAVIAKTIARLELTQAMTQLGRHVMAVSNGNRQMLESSGYLLSRRGKGQSAPEMPAPSNLQVTDGPVPCSLVVSVDGNPLFRSLTFQYSETDPATGNAVWISEFSTSTSHTFYNLTNEKRF